jgi:membrane-associated protease RseP (regulator of RpoE activity)
VLRFRLFDIPVGVHFSFLFIAFLAMGIYSGAALAAFVAAIFAGVLVHELGHALTARAFGARNVSITLFALGGVTMYATDPPLSAGRRFLISAAGSGAGIVTGGPLFLAWRAGLFDSLSRLARVGLWSFIIAALFWGLLNWVPIRPLDGGQMLTAGLEIVTPRHAETIARVVTVVVGGAAITVAIAYEQYFAAFFVGFLVLMGARGAGSSRTEPPPAPEPASRPEPGPEEEDPPAFPI